MEFCHKDQAVSAEYSAVCMAESCLFREMKKHYIVDFLAKREYNTARQAGQNAVLRLFS